MAGMLLNNTLYCYNITNEFSYLLDFIIGNSIITTILLYICSNIFKFCIWHRLIITANFINLLIANIDAIFIIPIYDKELLVLYYIIASIFIIIGTHKHINKNDESKT